MSDEIKTAANAVREDNMKKGGANRFDKRQKQVLQRSGLSQTDAGSQQREEILGKVVNAFERFFDAEFTRKGGRRPNWYHLVTDTYQREDEDGNLVTGVAPAMDLWRMGTLALTVMQDAVKRDWTLNTTVHNLGRQYHVEMYYHLMSSTNEGRKHMEAIDKWTKQKTMCPQYRITRAINHAQKMGYSFEDWPKEDYWKIGAFLYSGAIYSGYFTKEEVNDYDEKDVHDTRMVALTDEARADLLKRESKLRWLTPMFGPMASPPQPWNKLDNRGPYNDPQLAALTPMVKNASPEQKLDVQNALEADKMDDAVEALNTLQEVPLEINTYVLDALKQARETRGMSKMISSFPDLLRNELDKHDEAVLKGKKKEEKADYWKDRNEIALDNRTVDANLLNLDSHLQEAEELVELGVFWLPHQFDSRSRVYHTPHFGHHTQDYLRSLFLFHNKTPVKDNEAFLHLQIANSFGHDPAYIDPDTGEVGCNVDKLSLDGRMQWVQDNHDKILAAGEDANSSLEVFKYWAEADDSLQFLAGCREYYLYHQNPEHESGLVIGQDATNSGIQHYGAASLNRQLGKWVNLTPSKASEKPQDIYTEALRITIELLKRDKATYEAELPGLNDPDEIINKKRYITACEELLASEGKDWGIKRKVVKRPCMTWGYSSRRYGMKKQLKKDWMNKITKKARNGGFKDGHPFSEKGWVACDQLAKSIEEAISTVARPAADGMAFFQGCARVLARHELHMRFVTPMGFPMHQYYCEEPYKMTIAKDGSEKRQKIKKRQRLWLVDRDTNLPEKDGRGNFTQFTENVDARKSANAISPNIIHAMDATHLMMTVLTCKDAGVTDIMTVHDSFGTSVGNAHIMAEAVRKSFIALYEDYNIYSDLMNQCKNRLYDKLEKENPDKSPQEIDQMVDEQNWPQMPERGNLDLNGILESNYCFS